MRYSRPLLIGLLTFFLSGCGVSSQQSLKVSETNKIPVGANKSVVILPFADYSLPGTLETAYRRNLFVTENLADQFSKYGFQHPVPEDVFLYLADQKLINVTSFEENKTAKVEDELRKDWSGPMKQTLQRYINLTRDSISQGNQIDSPGTHGLTQQEIVKIGRHFSADYIVRGRIIQYKDRNDPSWAIWKKGILPFFFGIDKQILFGHSTIRNYDNLTPSEDGSNVKVAGAMPQAVVQVRIWVQDAYTGNVIWSNRSDIKSSPQSFFADNQYDILFEEATEQAISSLISDFAQVVYRVPATTNLRTQQ